MNIRYWEILEGLLRTRLWAIESNVLLGAVTYGHKPFQSALVSKN